MWTLVAPWARFLSASVDDRMMRLYQGWFGNSIATICADRKAQTVPILHNLVDHEPSQLSVNLLIEKG